MSGSLEEKAWNTFESQTVYRSVIEPLLLQTSLVLSAAVNWMRSVVFKPPFITCHYTGSLRTCILLLTQLMSHLPPI